MTLSVEPALVVQAPVGAGPEPFIESVVVLPGRGLMPLQITARHSERGAIELLHAPHYDPERRGFRPRIDPTFPGNASFGEGGAILIPFANRIRGERTPDGLEIATTVLDRHVLLPANWGGRRPGAQRYAMHGLFTGTAVHDIERGIDGGCAWLRGTVEAGNFEGWWISESEVTVEHRLDRAGYELRIAVANVGKERLPVGIGWHPYFQLEGDRRQARLRVPARSRCVVNDPDEVLPTGAIVPVMGTPYDFSARGGAPLGDLHLDDCFVDLVREDGTLTIELRDGGGRALRIVSETPQVRAVQVYAPPEQPFVVIEPQFNLADPYGDEWPHGLDTGMAALAPGERVEYRARLELL